MKFSFKRVLAFVLAVMLVVSLIPATEPMHVHAAGTLSTIDGLTASWTDATNSRGSASWSASGTSITGTTTGYKQIINRTVTSKLTLTNSSGGEATLSFNYSLTNGGSVSGAISSTSGSYSSTLADGASITITLKSPSGATTNTLNLTGLSLISTSAGDVTTTFDPAAVGGSYTVNGTAITASTEMTAAAGTEYTLVATAVSGYQFFGWFDADGNALDYNASYSFKPSANMTVVPYFVSSTTALFGVGSAKFDDLTAAGEYAAAGSNKIIILLNDGTVSGDHTIPAGVTLLVPFDASNTLYTAEPAHTNNNLLDTATWEQPTAYRTLTLAADANITVNGSISVSGKHFAGGGSVNAGGGGVPTEKVGFVQMVSGSTITLNSGAYLYAWGYVTGGGSITAKSGAKVYENFQVRDFRGGGATTSMANDGIVFPLSQYYVQNIEVPTTYEYGAEEHVYTSFYISGSSYSAGVKFIGDGAMFQPQAGCALTKDYIENQDRLALTVEGDAALANMSLSLAGTDIDSSTFILPINSNITININSGTTTLKQDLALLPGVELNIAQGAVLDLASGTGSGSIASGTGYNLFVYDLDEWSSGYSTDTFDPDNIEGSVKTTGLNFVHQAYQFIALKYAPGRTYTRTAADLKDVVIDVNGTIITNGFLYTTAGGANITSSGKTGVIAMNSGAGTELWTYQAAQVDTTPAYYAILCNSAALKNGDGSYLSTADAVEGTTYHYCATHDKWVKQITVSFDANGGNGTMASQILELPCCEKLNANSFTLDGYTFGSWNTAADNSGTAYADGAVINATEDVTLYAQWNVIVTTYSVTWNVDGNVSTIEVELGQSPIYNNGVDPTKATNNCTTYTFAGWKDNAGNVYGVGQTLPEGENYYTAIFTEGTSHTVVTDAAVAAGCETTGLTEGSHCEACGTVIVEQEEVPANGHNPGPDATCTTKQFCFDCGATLAPSTGHSPGEVVKENVEAAGCENSGYYEAVIYCTVCDEEISREMEIIAPEGHPFEALVTVIENEVAAGCDTDGSYDSVDYCTVCGEEDYRVTITVPATGHSYENGKCTACGDTISVTLPGSFNSWSGYEMTWNEGGYYTYEMHLDAGTYEFKIIEDGAWYGNNGTIYDSTHEYEWTFSTSEGTNCKLVSTAGTYTFTYNINTDGLEVSFVPDHTHSFGEPEYDWTMYYTVCMLRFHCQDESCGQSFGYGMDVSSKTENGKLIFTSTYELDGVSYSDSVSIDPVDSNVVYFYNDSTDWTNVYAYYWKDGEEAPVAWPGSLATDMGNGLFAFIVPEGYDNIIFNNGSDEQTVDLKIPETCENVVCPYSINQYPVSWGYFEPSAHTITFVVGDENVTEIYYYGQTPEFTGSTDKAQSGCTTYTFAGWDEEFAAVTGDATYTAIYTEGVSHSWSDATCTEAKTCSVCGATEGEALGHTGGEAVTENEIAADCTNDGSYDTVVYCTVCDDEISRVTTTIPATGHVNQVYAPCSGTHYLHCLDCGDVLTDNEDCTYDENHKCIYCGHVEDMFVTFMVGDKEWKVYVCEYGDTLDIADWANPEAETGYKFVGWYTAEGTSIHHGVTITENVVAYASFEKLTYKLTVYDLYLNVIFDTMVPHGENVYEYLKNLTVEDVPVNSETEIGILSLGDWSDDDSNWVEDGYTMPMADLNVYANPELTGWRKIGDEGWRYELEGDVQYTGWTEIDGSWYYLNPETGYRAEGISRVPYNTELGYGPDKETLDYCANKGIEFIDATTGLFYFDENGKFLSDYTDPVIDGEYARYAVNGHIAWHVGLIENQGSYFYFIGDEVNGGNVLATGDIYVIRNTTDFDVVIGGIYTFGSDGALFGYDGIITMANGTKRFYQNAQMMAGIGLTKVDENFIYVNSYGELIVNAEYWVPANELGIEAGLYSFDSNGFLVIPEPDPVKDGIYFENDAWYYYENGSIGYNKGLINTLVNWYDADGNAVWGEGGIVYVRSNGQLATGSYYVTNLSNYDQTVDVTVGTRLEFNEYGLMLTVKNGIVDGYYYENNQIVYGAGLIVIDGNYYYVRSNGQVVVGRDYWISNANDTGIKLGCYTFDENGVMQLPDTYGFTGIKDGYYYIDGAVAYGAGVVMLDDGTYIYVRSNGQLAVGKYWPTNLNGYLTTGEYDFGEDGILTIN